MTDQQTDYDSTQDTLNHIEVVRELIDSCVRELNDRAKDHDASKLVPPEKPIFDKFTPLLAKSEYLSEEYKANLAAMAPALAHHYATYRHHPEHFDNGVQDMNLIDVLEMLCDWKAATLRNPKGDLGSSIEQNANRFGYGIEIKWLLLNTAKDMGWL